MYISGCWDDMMLPFHAESMMTIAYIYAGVYKRKKKKLQAGNLVK
jgi:hypothetical protein